VIIHAVAAVAAVGVAVVVAVGVAVGIVIVAEPPHAATSVPALMAAAMERAYARMVTISVLLPLITLDSRGSA
jgi:hypothetical protein